MEFSQGRWWDSKYFGVSEGSSQVSKDARVYISCPHYVAHMTRKPASRKKISLSTDEEVAVPLDMTDIALLKSLGRNSRVSLSDLAKISKMSRQTVADRIRRMERLGIIKGWHVDLNPSTLGLPLSAYVRIRPMQGQLSTLARLAESIPNITECHRITGDDCFLMRLYVTSIRDLERIIDQLHPYGQTTTSIVQSTPVPLRSPPLPQPTE